MRFSAESPEPQCNQSHQVDTANQHLTSKKTSTDSFTIRGNSSFATAVALQLSHEPQVIPEVPDCRSPGTSRPLHPRCKPQAPAAGQKGGSGRVMLQLPAFLHTHNMPKQPQESPKRVPRESQDSFKRVPTEFQESPKRVPKESQLHIKRIFFSPKRGHHQPEIVPF